MMLTLLFFTGCSSPDERALARLERENIPFTVEDFVASAGRNDTEAVDLFLTAGMDADAFNIEGYTALMMAAEQGNAETTNLLLERGANPDAQGLEGITALMQAAFHNRAEVVEILLEAKADTRPTDDKGWSAITKAANQGHARVVGLLTPHSADQQARALAIAARVGHLEVVEALLDNGTEVDATDRDEKTALIHAATAGNEDIARYLLQKGADPLKADREGHTAAAYARHRFHPQLALLLQNAEVGILPEQAMITARRDPSPSLDVSTTPNPVEATPTPVPEPSPEPMTTPALVEVPSTPEPTPDQPETDDVTEPSERVEIAEGIEITEDHTEPVTVASTQTDRSNDQGFVEREQPDEVEIPTPPVVAEVRPTPPPVEDLSPDDLLNEVGPGIGPAPMGLDTPNMTLEDYQESALPVMLTGVGAGIGEFQLLDGSDRRVYAREGDSIESTNLVVAQIRERVVVDKSGDRAEASEARVRDRRSGQEFRLVQGLTTRAGQAYAMLRIEGEPEAIRVRSADEFTLPSDPTQVYRVLDLRRDQVVLQTASSGETFTVSR